jgi:hypothetical protein
LVTLSLLSLALLLPLLDWLLVASTMPIDRS